MHDCQNCKHIIFQIGISLTKQCPPRTRFVVLNTLSQPRVICFTNKLIAVNIKRIISSIPQLRRDPTKNADTRKVEYV